MSSYLCLICPCLQALMSIFMNAKPKKLPRSVFRHCTVLLLHSGVGNKQITTAVTVNSTTRSRPPLPPGQRATTGRGYAARASQPPGTLPSLRSASHRGGKMDTQNFYSSEEHDVSNGRSQNAMAWADRTVKLIDVQKVCCFFLNWCMLGAIICPNM